MKSTILLLLILVSGSVFAGEVRPPEKRGTKKAAPAPAPLTLPAGATEFEPGTYRFTDAQGKKWIYRKTPFGLARFEDKPAPAVSPTAGKASEIVATEDGDLVRFERSGPFGAYRWVRNKADLSDEERAALERSRRQSSSATAADRK